LSEPQRLLYELVASCCVAETLSMTTLVTLLDADPAEPLLSVVRELAKDEVTHSQLGWAYLTYASVSQDVSFLGPRVPRMLDGSVGDDVFAAHDAALEDPALEKHGVLRPSTRRAAFVATLEEVIFPGLARAGVDVTHGQQWLDTRKAN